MSNQPFTEARFALSQLARRLDTHGEFVNAGDWQGIKHEDLQVKQMIELLNAKFTIGTERYETQDIYDDIRPYTPWAIEHMVERVSGLPTNPGEAYKVWPHFNGNNDQEFRKFNGRFFGTYQERIWPKYANGGQSGIGPGYQLGQSQPNTGIYFPYGDLLDVVNLLKRNPSTRQAFLPLFFPEDTGAVHGDRAFCSLGYHFYIREGKLHMNYYMRSADLVRHFKNDVYFAVAIMYYVLAKLDGAAKSTGTLNIHITSLHIFESDSYNLKKLTFLDSYYDREKAEQTRNLFKGCIPHII